ncbi:MAG: TldE/PmbA family protein [Actinobacteria bacterium]|nr:TldE/PmbA family protein [Actinomycetota bacterium]
MSNATSDTVRDVRTYIDDLSEYATSHLTGDEVLLASFDGEDSDFVRFNGGKVRQAGSVQQLSADLDLSEGARHTTATVGLSGQADSDKAAIARALSTMREQRAVVPDDPYFMYSTDVASSEHTNPGSAPDGAGIIDSVTTEAGADDLVGIWASGRQFSAFTNSLGQRNWFDSNTFNLDWSLYLHADKATKQGYAGFEWNDEAFAAKVATQRLQLDALRRDPITLDPGDYRTYLTPSAVKELTDMLSWGGFSLRAHRAMDAPLLKMVTEGVSFAPMLTITENTSGGVAPNFEGQGFLRPDAVPLITNGKFASHLVSPRSAKEFDVPTNGASSWEAPHSIYMDSGDLATDSAMAELGTGLYVGNLWYLNFSDRANCRTTGMTRFATFWIENGEIVAPVTALRFDDTAFGLFGDRLEALTDTSEVLLDPESYGARSTNSARLPGALINDMRFTL